MTIVALNVCIAGSTGRMGQTLIETALSSPAQFKIASALDVGDSPFIGHDAGERIGRVSGARVQADVDAAVRMADVLIDFTRPAGTMTHVAACARHRVAAVIGTTGLDSAQRQSLADHAATIPIVCAPNMSVGVN